MNVEATTVERTSIKVRLGTIAFTSLITFGFEPASNDSSFTLKIVFSFGFSCELRVRCQLLDFGFPERNEDLTHLLCRLSGSGRGSSSRCSSSWHCYFLDIKSGLRDTQDSAPQQGQAPHTPLL